MKNTKTLWTVGLALLACATGAAYWYTVSFMKWNVPLYVVGMALLSDDCSAMYCGKHWDCNGSVVRYNVMYDLGDEDHSPNGIYWDDGMTGQTAYGNLIVHYAGDLGNIAESVEHFSDLSGNAVYKLNALKKLFKDPDHGDYTLRDDVPVFDDIPGFEPLPLSEIGRYRQREANPIWVRF